MATIANTTASQAVNGKTVNIFKVGPRKDQPFYRLTWMTILRQGAQVNQVKALVYSDGVTSDIDNLFAADTYAEIQAQCTTLGITAPDDPQAKSTL